MLESEKHVDVSKSLMPTNGSDHAVAASDHPPQKTQFGDSSCIALLRDSAIVDAHDAKRNIIKSIYQMSGEPHPRLIL